LTVFLHQDIFFLNGSAENSFFWCFLFACILLGKHWCIKWLFSFANKVMERIVKNVNKIGAKKNFDGKFSETLFFWAFFVFSIHRNLDLFSFHDNLPIEVLLWFHALSTFCAKICVSFVLHFWKEIVLAKKSNSVLS